MLRLLKFLFTGSWHEHKWVVIRTGNIGYGGRVNGIRYFLQCSQCGKIKHTDCM